MEERMIVELWHLLVGMAAVAAGFFPVFLARKADQRRVEEWRREVDSNNERLEAALGSAADFIRWRATVDAQLQSGHRYDEEHRQEHAAILKGVGELKSMMSGFDKRLAVMESKET